MKGSSYGSRITPEERPLFHVTPTEAWLNDPNGFSCYQGKYHVASRKALARYQEGEIKLRFIIDRFSAEVFVNDGEQVMTSSLYTPQSADSISFKATGSAIMDIEKYNIIL